MNQENELKILIQIHNADAFDLKILICDKTFCGIGLGIGRNIDASPIGALSGIRDQL
jgi:hypothetical protein